MNIKISMENLSIRLQQKNLIFITGNIYEVFLKKEGRELLSLNDKIADIVKNKLEQKTLWYHSLDKGASKNLLDKNAEWIDINTTDAINKITENINSKDDNKESQTFIIDFADIIFGKSNSDEESLTAITKVLSALLISQNQNYQLITKNKHQTKVIFIMRNPESIMDFISNKNIEYSEVIINKPDNKERRELFSRLASRFNISNDQELRTKGDVQNEAAGLTSKMSNKEILQLARIENIDDKEITFKELYNISTLRKKKSSWEELAFDEVQNVAKYLSDEVFGQEFATKKTARTIKRSYLGLSGSFQGINSNKPKGILFYCGPTGVGKTEMAKRLTEFLFRDRSKMIRFDMSEFAQEHSDARLLGAPPGYVGFEGGGELTNAVKENPNSLLLFDEIEKANPRILDKFLQILEDGRLTSGKGELINFSETFIIFTSNIGSATVDSSQSEIDVRNKFMEEVSKEFIEKLKRPEILNRIGRENIIPFNFIKDKNIQSKMLVAKLAKQNEVLEIKHNIKLEWDNETILDVLDNLKDDKNFKASDGGRGLMEIATSQITDTLVDFMLINNEKIEKNKDNEGKLIIKMNAKRNKIEFSFNR